MVAGPRGTQGFCDESRVLSTASCQTLKPWQVQGRAFSQKRDPEPPHLSLPQPRIGTDRQVAVGGQPGRKQKLALGVHMTSTGGGRNTDAVRSDSRKA